MCKIVTIMQKRAETACNSPQNGVSCFLKKAFAILGTVFGGTLHMRWSLFAPFLFSEKIFCQNWDCCMNRCKNVYVHFQPILILKKNVVKVDDVFAICLQERVGVLWFSHHHLQTPNRRHRHLNRQIHPMICDTFYPTIFATGQCRAPLQMPPLCKETLSLPIVHLFLRTNWWLQVCGSVELCAPQCEWVRMQLTPAMVQCIRVRALFQHDTWGTCFSFSKMTVNTTCRICVRMPWWKHLWFRELPCTLDTRPLRVRVMRQFDCVNIALFDVDWMCQITQLLNCFQFFNF